ncbi:Double-stranded RNA-binding domain [Dillenia turbinata]|uniref:Double-stranded RNA-binding domain n=1 Tax=Dillenia turbinata TaxID=194707 RepID=A0AAN8V530_9MAGN
MNFIALNPRIGIEVGSKQNLHGNVVPERGSKEAGEVEMYKNQLQELAQRSCFNLSSYACIREGPDHAPRFKASVNFNGEIFESPNYCTTLRQAEHAAAEVALNSLSSRGPSKSLTARVLDETGVYKNLLQETAHRAGLKLPVYTTVRSGPGHVPIFTCTVELAGMNFRGEPAKTKKQAEKNAAIAAWSALKQIPNLGSGSLPNRVTDGREEQDQAIVARVLSNFRSKDEIKPSRGKRIIKGGGASSFNNSLLQYQKWKSMDHQLMETLPEGQTQKQNSFLSLLPPPPPRTVSKILPPPVPTPTTSRDSTPLFKPPLQEQQVLGAKSQVNLQDLMHYLLEEIQRGKEKWLKGKWEITKNPNEKEISNLNSSLSSPFPLSNRNTTSLPDERSDPQIQISNGPYGCSNPSQIPVYPLKPHSEIQMPTPTCNYTGGMNLNSHRIAPAVHIRSVIPVCAAPPTSTSSTKPNSINRPTGEEEASSSSTSSANSK